MQWFFNSPFPFYWEYVSNFFGHLFSLGAWTSLIAAGFSFLILILIPGFALSYLLREKMDLSLRASFALALGFIVPLILFYALGLSHLYYKIAWLVAGLILSGISIWKFRKNLLTEWKESQVSRLEKIFYLLVGLYIFYMYIALLPNGTIDFDILFGQIGPASFLFNEHYYNPFDMGALPITRHELFPGPISYNSVFMLGAAPWVGIAAALVFVAPLVYRMFGQIAEFFVLKGSQYWAVVFSLITFFGFRFRNGRGTAMAMIFLFAFFLLAKIYPRLLEKGETKFKEVLKPAIANSIFVAMSLYVNIEIASILLALMVFVFIFAWLANYRALMKTIALSFAGGFLLYLPWFATVAKLLFADKFWPFMGLYFAMVLLALLLSRLPKIEIKENLLSKIALSLFVLFFAAALYFGQLINLFRVPSFVAYGSVVSMLILCIYSFRKSDFKKLMFILPVWFFALGLTIVYPSLRQFFVGIGAPESLLFVLFDKPLGSVFPELLTKTYEYFLPLFTILSLAAILTLLKKNWPWAKSILYVSLVIFFYVVCLRIQSSDFDDRVRGQTLGANLLLSLASEFAYGEGPGWYKEPSQEVIAVLHEVKKPGDRIFSFKTAFNPYFPETQSHYIVEGIGTVALDKEDILDPTYSIEVLDQVIEAGANYLLISTEVDPTLWLSDARVEILKVSSDKTLILARIVK